MALNSAFIVPRGAEWSVMNILIFPNVLLQGSLDFT